MKTIAELQKLRQDSLDQVHLRKERSGIRVVVGMATCGIAAGARPVLMTLLKESKRKNVENILVTQTGCLGSCEYEPIIEVFKPGEGKVTYVRATPEKAVKIMEEHIIKGEVVTDYCIGAYTK